LPEEIYNAGLDHPHTPVRIDARKGWILQITVNVSTGDNEFHPGFDLRAVRDEDLPRYMSSSKTVDPLLEMTGQRYIDTCIKFDRDETVYFHVTREYDPVPLNLRLVWIGPDTDEPNLEEAPQKIKELWGEVTKHRSYCPKINPQLNGAREIPYDEARSLLIRNFPRINTWGWDLLVEKRTKYWGGVLARAVEKDDDPNRRCLQYLFTWTRQSTIFSLHWLVVIPFIMTLIGLVILWLWAPEIALAVQSREAGQVWEPILEGYALWPGLAYSFLWLETILTGFEPTLKSLRDPLKPNPHLQPAVITGLFGLFSWTIGIYPEILIIYALAGVIALVLTLLFMATGTAAHKMDYLPVFVWLRKRIDRWETESICWDYWHYYSIRTISVVSRPDGPQFLMDNPWHSLRRYHESTFAYSTDVSQQKEDRRSYAICILLILAIGTMLVAGLLQIPNFVDISIRIYALMGIAMVLWLSEKRIHAEDVFIDKYKIDENMHHLSGAWLKALWNLYETPKKARGKALHSHKQKDHAKALRLVVISKMQNPYIEDPEFWTSFRDDSDYIYQMK
jgi:hypothetical protein